MPRPGIVLAPDTSKIGENFSVGFSNASSISRVTLVETGSVTHGVNMDQAFVISSLRARIDAQCRGAEARSQDRPHQPATLSRCTALCRNAGSHLNGLSMKTPRGC
jgi:hypothetical protein